MNKSKIEWCDYSWNPVTGCLHGCEYCYARRITDRFSPNCKEVQAAAHYVGIGLKGLYEIEDPWAWGERTLPYPFGFSPTFHKYRLDEPSRKTKGVKIFVCSMADLFGEWVPDKWIDEVMKVVAKNPRHKFIFLTKSPSRYLRLAEKGMLPAMENAWFGSTITTPEDEFWWSNAHNTFVSIEPILADFSSAGDEEIKKVDWVIIGAMTGPGAKDHQPKKEWIENIINDCRLTGTPIFMKNNLAPYWEDELIQEWPKNL